MSHTFVGKSRQDAKMANMLNTFFEKNDRITQKDLTLMLSKLPTVGKKRKLSSNILRKHSSTKKSRRSLTNKKPRYSSRKSSDMDIVSSSSKKNTKKNSSRPKSSSIMDVIF